jgi:Epoxide hydrolase N terminus
MANGQPFHITVTEEALALLKRKLEDTRFPDEVNEAHWEYGAPLADIRRLTERWKNGYDWRAHERVLNELPMFTRSIEVEGFGELNVHYVHKRSPVKGAIPLLFVHGCTSPPHPSPNLAMLIVQLRAIHRARKLPRGDENITAFDGILGRSPIFPRCCP